MKKIVLLLLLSALALSALEIVVGFQKDGATDRMARVMAKFLQKEFKEEVTIRNIPGKGSKNAAEYVLSQPADKLVLFASTFAPYLSTTTLTNEANYSIDDFKMINLQWFDYDLVAVHKSSPFKSLLELFKYIKTAKKPIRVGVNYKSSGHLLLKILLDKFEIPQKNVMIHTYSGGKFSRDALRAEVVDFIVIPANGSELFKNQIRPLAVSKSKRTKRWDAPTIKEVLAPLGIDIPLLNGSIRGFAVSSKFKEKEPTKFNYLHFVFKRMLASKQVQNELKMNHIGYLWLGEKKSNEVILDAHEVVKFYSDLLK